MSEQQVHLYRLAVGRTSINGPDGPWTVVTTDGGTPVLETFGETAEESERIARQIVARWNAVGDIRAELLRAEPYHNEELLATVEVLTQNAMETK